MSLGSSRKMQRIFPAVTARSGCWINSPPDADYFYGFTSLLLHRAMYVQLLEWHPWICGKETITGQKWDEASCIRQQNVQLSLGLRWLHEEYIITFGMQTEEEHLARVTLSWAMHHNLGATTCLKAKTLIYAMRKARLFSLAINGQHLISICEGESERAASNWRIGYLCLFLLHRNVCLSLWPNGLSG